MRNRNPSPTTARKAHAGKESTVANADAAADASPVANAPVNVEMVIRVWAPAQHDHDSTANPNHSIHHPGVLALIEDVVASRHGVLVAADDRLHVTGLKQPADALLVSRQIQTCMQGFRHRQGAATVALSIAMDATTQGKSSASLESDQATDSRADRSAGSPAEPSYDLVTLLKLSKPAQVLATHDLCQHIQDIKGLPLKSFPARFGVYEYLWTAEDKLDLLQSEPQLTLAALPATPLGDRAKSTAPPAPAAPISSRAAIVQNEPTSAPEIDDDARLFGIPRSVFIPAVAVLAVAIIAFFGIRALYHGPSTSPVAQSTSQPSSTGTAQAPSVPTASSAGTSATETATAAPPPPTTVPTQAPKPKLKTAVPASKATASEKHAPAQPAGCSLSDDSTHLIRLAQQYRGRGDYKNAERIFRQVLQCEPNNAAAREGLSRAEAGEAESRR